MDLSIIKELRKKQGLSQKELANKLEVSSSYIQKIECNKKNPSISTLKKLSSALNIELSILLDDGNNEFSTSISTKDLPSNIPLDILNKFSDDIDKNISIADKLDDIYLLENLYKYKFNHLKNTYEHTISLLTDENNNLRLSLAYIDAKNKNTKYTINDFLSLNKEEIEFIDDELSCEEEIELIDDFEPTLAY